MKETRQNNKIRDTIKHGYEHLREMHVFIKRIKEHPELFNKPTPIDLYKIITLNERNRNSFVFCELVKKEHQANVYWRRPIPKEAITTALTRIEQQLQQKSILPQSHELQLKNIEKILRYLQKWTTTPLILDKQERAQNDRRAWRVQMQRVFDTTTNTGAYTGPFTSFYHSNAIRADLYPIADFLFNLNKNCELIGLPTKLTGKHGEITNSALHAKRIVDYSRRVQRQKMIVDQVHTLVRHIFNTIGTDNF